MEELKGLFSYLGSKRKMVKYLLSAFRGCSFADGFMGSGVVSLAAKLHNYKVIANDNSFISSLIGYGIIENNNLRLKKEDIAFLYMPAKEKNPYCENNYQTIAPLSTLRFIDNALENIYTLKDATYKSLMLYTIIKLFLSSKPYDNADTQHLVKDKIYKKREKKEDSYANLKGRQYGTLYTEHITKQVRSINRSIFCSVEPARFYNLDIFDFLQRPEVKGDTIYLDPPYPGAIMSYESYYAAITDMITKGGYEQKESSVFNTDGRNALSKMVELSKNFDNIIISLYTGKADDDAADGRISSEEQMEIVRKYRPKAVLKEIPFKYSLSPKKNHIYTETLIISHD